MMGVRAYIAPSTQAQNITALGQTEEEVMHLIAEELAMMLRESGAVVFVGKKAQTIEEMVNEANSLAVDCYVSIHSNAFDKKARGCIVFHYPGSIGGKRLADAIYKYMETLTPTDDKGVQTNSAYYELKNTKAPSVIAEVDFHDTYEGAKWISENTYNIAVAIGQGTCDFLGITLKKNPYRKAIMDIQKIVQAL
jgi:N-acetylmuramoyl-L-alanine amidase